MSSAYKPTPFTSILNNSRYKNNPWLNANTRKRIKHTNQEPKKPYREKKKPDLTESHELCIDDFDALLVPPNQRQQFLRERSKDNDALRGMRFENRHRYGNDVDILRATFVKSTEELEKEKFRLILSTRSLLKEIFFLLKDIPKTERYVLGGEIRKLIYNLLRTSIACKQKYYRRNLLIDMDLDLSMLRELFRAAHEQYPDWITDIRYAHIFEVINEVGAIVGGLMKTAVA